MKSFDDDWPLAALRAALGNTVVACIAALVTSALTGAAVGIVAWWEWPSTSREAWELLYLWALHWGVAGALLWGLPFIFFHIWGLYRLLATELDPIASLAIILVNQTVVSTIATVLLEFNRGYKPYRAIGGGISLVLLALLVLWMDHKRRKTIVLGE